MANTMRLRAAALLSCLALLGAPVAAGGEGLLPAGTDLGEQSLDEPREIFKTDVAGGERSYLVRLGDMAFSAPGILGPAARQARMSCATCHRNATNNPSLFIPGLSTKGGTFDTTSALFNPAADDHRLDALRIPSLRGTRFLAPYGHDGRFASLRDFIRNVIVGEFAGPEPPPVILDALVAYLQEIEFLPNPRLAAGGRLAAGASPLERRGEALFFRPFPHDPSLSCAACHTPSAAFTDRRLHDVGSGGFEKTPTLLGANFNAPYFHDGRYDDYAAVVGHFDRVFALGLGPDETKALVAYLRAVGDGEQPFEPAGVDDALVEVEYFVSVLDTALPAHDRPVIALTVDTVIGELRELTERFPERRNSVVRDGRAERGKARAALRELVLDLRRVGLAGEAGEFDAASAALARYRAELEAAAPALEDAEPYSLFDPERRRAYLAELQCLQSGAAN
ncbi:MAG TPA: cytochrome c peroxidase [Stellaceae bacterium]|nr:cytochrome c peroxidase [Stellaceae bacterium]